MKDQHRATPEQWQAIEANGHLPTRSTIRELLHRIEALEATQQAHADASHVIDPEREKMARELMQAAGFAPRWSEFEACAASIEAKPNHSETPDSSLVKRVANAMDGATEWQARAAIREVAAWLREEKGYGPGWIIRLEQEAE